MFLSLFQNTKNEFNLLFWYVKIKKYNYDASEK